MRIVGPIHFWRGCVIYHKNKIKNKNTPLPCQGAFRGSGGGGHPEHIPVFRALLETTNPHQKANSVHAKIQTRSTPEHIPVIRALLETTDPRDQDRTPEHILVFRALLRARSNSRTHPSFQSIGPLGRCFLWVEMSVCPSVHLSVCPCVRLCVCSLLRNSLMVFLPPLPKVGCPIFLEIRNPWGKVMERSGLRYEHFCLKIV